MAFSGVVTLLALGASLHGGIWSSPFILWVHIWNVEAWGGGGFSCVGLCCT